MSKCAERGGNISLSSQRFDGAWLRWVAISLRGRAQ